jgi:hypothetical protein
MQQTEIGILKYLNTTYSSNAVDHNDSDDNNSIEFNSCLYTCKLNSTEANYKVSTST